MTFADIVFFGTLFFCIQTATNLEVVDIVQLMGKHLCFIMAQNIFFSLYIVKNEMHPWVLVLALKRASLSAVPRNLIKILV